jgi:hypothetical protein
MSTLKPIKQTRRSAESEVQKLRCNCGEQSWHFRISVIGNQVFAECSECLADWGPFFVSNVLAVRPDDNG